MHRHACFNTASISKQIVFNTWIIILKGNQTEKPFCFFIIYRVFYVWNSPKFLEVNFGIETKLQLY